MQKIKMINSLSVSNFEIRSHRENLRMHSVPEECEENDVIEFVERLKDK